MSSARGFDSSGYNSSIPAKPSQRAVPVTSHNDSSEYEARPEWSGRLGDRLSEAAGAIDDVELFHACIGEIARWTGADGTPVNANTMTKIYDAHKKMMSAKKSEVTERANVLVDLCGVNIQPSLMQFVHSVIFNINMQDRTMMAGFINIMRGYKIVLSGAKVSTISLNLPGSEEWKTSETAYTDMLKATLNAVYLNGSHGEMELAVGMHEGVAPEAVLYVLHLMRAAWEKIMTTDSVLVAKLSLLAQANCAGTLANPDATNDELQSALIIETMAEEVLKLSPEMQESVTKSLTPIADCVARNTVLGTKMIEGQLRGKGSAPGLLSSTLSLQQEEIKAITCPSAGERRISELKERLSSRRSPFLTH